MKKLLLLAFLVTGIVANAQTETGQHWGQRDKAWYPFATIGFDARNCIDGSDPTGGRAELDFQLKLGARANDLEVAMVYERFQAIDFQYYGVNVNYVTEIAKNTDIALGVEGGSVVRWGGFNFITGGANLELRYEIKNSHIILGAQGNARVRPDIWYKDSKMPITYSGWINATYKFN